MRLGDIMERRVVTIRPGDTASAAWTRMRRQDIRHLVVMEDSEIVGVISERDLGGRTGGDLRRGRTVRNLMTPQIVTATPDMTLEQAADLMRSRLIGSLPVVKDGELAGIVTATDVFDALGGATGALSWAERQMLRRPSSSRELGGRTVPRTRKPAKSARRRARPPKSPAPEPFTAALPRSVKRTVGRSTTAELVPASIRAFDTDLEPADRDWMREQLGAKLGKFASSIERVSVRVRDVNGPRGGVDKACRIKVVLSSLPSVVVEEQAGNDKAAFRKALDDAVRSVRKSLDRRRTKAKKSAAR